jgi:hypothetical protein
VIGDPNDPSKQVRFEFRSGSRPVPPSDRLITLATAVKKTLDCHGISVAPKEFVAINVPVKADGNQEQVVFRISPEGPIFSMPADMLMDLPADSWLTDLGKKVPQALSEKGIFVDPLQLHVRFTRPALEDDSHNSPIAYSAIFRIDPQKSVFRIPDTLLAFSDVCRANLEDNEKDALKTLGKAKVPDPAKLLLEIDAEPRADDPDLFNLTWRALEMGDKGKSLFTI